MQQAENAGLLLCLLPTAYCILSPMDPRIPEIIDGVLSDFDLDAERLLAALVGALVERHVDVELRRLGRREPYPIHNERADALKAVNDALHQARTKAGV